MSHLKINPAYIFPKISFWTLILICVVMGVATFAEKNHGTEYAYHNYYGSWWFLMLWTFLATMSIVGIFKGKAYKNYGLFLVHISFIVILAGALCTRIFSFQSYISLQKKKAISFVQSGDKSIKLPFKIQLDSFFIKTYPGTDSPADYVSRVRICKGNNEWIQSEISMNRILDYKGFRFYQSSFSPDLSETILSVNYDPWGIAITYCGYFLFMLSMVVYLINPTGYFRQLLRHPALKTSLILVLFLIPLRAEATNTIAPDSITIDKDRAVELGQLCILYDGRISSISAFANDFSLKLTGKATFAHLNAEQVLAGFLFLPEKWQRVAMLDIDNPSLREELDSPEGKAALIDFFDKFGNYKLSKYQDIISNNAPKNAFEKEIVKLNEKVQLINMLHSGVVLQIFPIQKGKNLQWLSPVSTIPKHMYAEDSIFIRSALTRYYFALKHNNANETTTIIREISRFQQKHAGSLLPERCKIQLEIRYLKADLVSWLFKVNLTLGILGLLLYGFMSSNTIVYFRRIMVVLSVVSFILLTLNLATRAFIAGYLPMSNGLETMQVIGWCALLFPLLVHKRIPSLIPFGFLISGTTLLVAHLGMINPKITPLMPVLASPLLSIHVSIIMIAYTLFAFVALNSISSIIRIIITPARKYEQLEKSILTTKIHSLICLYPAILLLGAGIFIGAIWANISWGHYWTWDPKEVWALITFLVYSLALHPKVPFIKHPFWFQVYGLLAFSTVLMTYFGVNYFLGGMHSYAGATEGINYAPAMIVTVLTILLIGVAYYKMEK